jgi:hypothetical protein
LAQLAAQFVPFLPKTCQYYRSFACIPARGAQLPAQILRAENKRTVAHPATKQGPLLTI